MTPDSLSPSVSEKPYQDPTSPGNAERYRTGKLCIERGCDRPAGTAWSHLWCVECNIVRMDRISASLAQLASPRAVPESQP
jgi:hypothetical protein